MFNNSLYFLMVCPFMISACIDSSPPLESSAVSPSSALDRGGVEPLAHDLSLSADQGVRTDQAPVDLSVDPPIDRGPQAREDLAYVEDQGDQTPLNDIGMDDIGMDDIGMDDIGMDDLGEMIDQSPNDLALPRCGDGITQEGVEDCDDANDINTDTCTNTCHAPRCGDGFTQEGVEECDDGNDINADTCTNTCHAPRCGDGITQGEERCDEGVENGSGTCGLSCLPRYSCLELSPQISCQVDWAPSLAAHHFASIDECKFALQAPTEQEWTSGEQLAQELVDSTGEARTLLQVLNSTNRVMSSTLTSATRYRLENHDEEGYRWNSGDQGTGDWWPQGVTGSEDMGAGGVPIGGKRVIMVSWYHKTEARPTKGARIAIVDLSVSPPEYRFVLLVEPYRSSNLVQFKSAEYDTGDALHVGGIVWYGHYLYVADTSEGMRVYDLNKIFSIDNTADKTKIGWHTGETYAHGYKYALPLIARYRRPRATEGDLSCAVKFSSISLDRSNTPHRIISSEYYRSERYGKTVEWLLDSTTHKLDARVHYPNQTLTPIVYGQNAYVTGENKMQGAIRVDDTYYISSSSQWFGSIYFLNYGRLYRNRLGRGASEITAWPYGCEALYYESDENLIWTATEYEEHRELVGIPLPLLP